MDINNTLERGNYRSQKWGQHYEQRNRIDLEWFVT
jgi:hypothetical protein